jgi:hypothetical protein
VVAKINADVVEDRDSGDAGMTIEARVHRKRIRIRTHTARSISIIRWLLFASLAGLVLCDCPEVDECPVGGPANEISGRGRCVPNQEADDSYDVVSCWITDLHTSGSGGFIFFNSASGQSELHILRCVFKDVSVDVDNGRMGGVAAVVNSADGSSMTRCCILECFAFFGGAGVCRFACVGVRILGGRAISALSEAVDSEHIESGI